MKIRIGIVGAGIGGLAAAHAVERFGHDVVVFEQASRFARVGADINLTPNAVRALDELGLGGTLRETAARPTFRISRTWDTGEETSRIEMARAAEQRYGAPQLTMHRADLMSALEASSRVGDVRLGNKLVGAEQVGDGVTLRFVDGEDEVVDLLVGADGIHSTVRAVMFGPEHPTFTGVVAYRAVVPMDRLGGASNLDAFTKWWGPNLETQIVTFPLNRGKDMFIFATTPQESWRAESWTQPGSVEELRGVYRDFHPEARIFLDACDEVLKSALYVRDPLPVWSKGAMTLLGDACHPMMPFMAQGAGQAIEDAVVLARCLGNLGDRPDPGWSGRLAAYEATRRERTAAIQIGSRGNNWLRDAENADWVYEYDAWTVPIAAPEGP